MKLLLDEMYPPSIADGLRARGHDAVALVERPTMRSIADADVFAAAQRDQRTVVTENVRDFAPIANDCDARGQAHHGLVLVHAGEAPTRRRAHRRCDGHGAGHARVALRLGRRKQSA